MGDAQKPSDEKREEQINAQKPPKKGTILTDAGTKSVYKVTKPGQNGTVVYMKCKNTKAKNIVVPNTVTIDGITYRVVKIAAGALKNHKSVKKITIGNRVTSIGSRAFANCPKLTTIRIRTEKLSSKKVSKTAFAGISDRTTIYVKKAKKSTYQKLMQKKGLTKSVTIKEY